MHTYISILRGINVSGQKKIEMAGLKDLYEQLSFKDVSTYIQSGNIVFKSDERRTDQLVEQLEQAISKKYKFHVPVIIRSLEELNTVIASNPFTKDNSIDIEKLHVTFLREAPEKTRLESIQTTAYSPDRFIAGAEEIFVYCPGGYGNTKLNNNFFENKLKVTATTRNWKTVNKLAEMAVKI
jgi:uncharacterized protein (DUF1697 family)